MPSRECAAVALCSIRRATMRYEQLLALRTKYPDSNEVRTEQQQLAFAFLERTRTALAAGDVDTAQAS